MKKTLFTLLIIIFFGLLAIRALLGSGFYTSHDGEHHLTRMAAYYLALADGQFPPRWAPNFNGHLGSPIFVFIYPLPYMIGATLHVLRLSFVDSLKLALGVSYLLSGWAFYFWLKPKFGSLPATIGALFYLWAPYRFLLIFVRGAYPESLAYTFVPLVFLAVDKIIGGGTRKWVAFGSFAIAGLLLSQNLVGFIFLPLAAFYTLVSRPNRSTMIKLAVALLLGLSLSAFIYLPDIWELSNTQYSRLMTYSQSNFVYFWQFFRSPWGFGFSLAGPGDGMSFQIGLTQLLVVAMSVTLALKAKLDRQFSLFIFSLFGLAAAVFLMTESPLVHFVWQHVPGLSTIDYPWRLLGVTVFTTSLMATWLISQLPDKWRWQTAVLLVLFLLINNRNFLRVNARLDMPDSYLLTFAGRDTHLGEFTPQGRITVGEFPYSRRAEFYDGRGTIDHQMVSSIFQSYKLTIQPKQGLSKFRLNTLYFPGWKVFVDGKEAKLGEGMEVTGGIDVKTNVDTSGMMGMFLPSGKHQVEAKFTETKVRLLADWLSLITLSVCLAILIL